jgi:hypothetical protein
MSMVNDFLRLSDGSFVHVSPPCFPLYAYLMLSLVSYDTFRTPSWIYLTTC